MIGLQSGLPSIRLPIQTIPSTNHKTRPSTLNKHEMEDTPRDDTRRVLHIRLSLKIGRFQSKPNTQDCVRPAGLGWVSASPLPLGPMCGQGSKVSPSANYNKFKIRGQTSFSYFIVIRLRPMASAIPRPPLSKNNARSIPSPTKACQFGERKAASLPPCARHGRSQALRGERR